MYVFGLWDTFATKWVKDNIIQKKLGHENNFINSWTIIEDCEKDYLC